MRTRFLMVTAVAEAAIGVALLLAPGTSASLLLGATLTRAEPSWWPAFAARR